MDHSSEPNSLSRCPKSWNQKHSGIWETLPEILLRFFWRLLGTPRRDVGNRHSLALTPSPPQGQIEQNRIILICLFESEEGPRDVQVTGNFVLEFTFVTFTSLLHVFTSWNFPSLRKCLPTVLSFCGINCTKTCWFRYRSVIIWF